jgi:hypothetical protein
MELCLEFSSIIGLNDHGPKCESEQEIAHNIN